MLAGIAWKNIWRNKRRSAVILAAIAIGLCGGVFATGVMIGMADSMVETAINRELGHLQLHTKAFKDNPLIQNAIPHADSLVTRLRLISGVVGVSGRTRIEGMASSPSANAGVRIVGIQPAAEAEVTSLATHVVEGTYFRADGRNPLLMGKRLAQKLNLRLRSKVVVSFAGADGSIIYGAFRIAGLFETESSIFDKTSIFVTAEDVTRLLGSAPVVHEIAVRFAGNQDQSGVIASLQASRPELAVESWKELAPDLKLTAELTDVSMLFFLGIILFGLLFGITNTMLMSILDRVREFGVVMAIGMKRRRLFLQVVLETLFLSLCGSLIGITLGAISIGITNRTGIDLSIFADGLSLYGIGTMCYPSVPPGVYGVLAVMVIITAFVAAVYPATKATRLNPAQAIRTYA